MNSPYDGDLRTRNLPEGGAAAKRLGASHEGACSQFENQSVCAFISYVNGLISTHLEQ